MLDKYFKTNNRYQSWYNSVINIITTQDKGEVYTYFGNVCRFTLTDLTTGEQKADRLLNAPVQSTSNDIVMHMVNKTVRDFRNLGIGPDKFRVYMVRHDEPIFMMHRSCLKYLNVIKRNTVIQVDDWGPITMSLEVGKYYSIDESEKYADYIGNEDVSQGAIVVPRPEMYNPFIAPHECKQEFVRVDFNNGEEVSVVIGNETIRYEVSKNVHYKFAVHKFLAQTKKKYDIILPYKVYGTNIKFNDIYVDDVYLTFLGGDTDG